MSTELIATELAESEPAYEATAEQQLLGSLFDPNVPDCLNAPFVRDVQPGHFFDDSHRVIFEAAKAVHVDGKPLDSTLIIDRLKATGRYELAGGGSYLMKLIHSVPHGGYAQHYAEVVIERWRQREQREFTLKLAKQVQAGRPAAEVLGMLEGFVTDSRETTAAGKAAPSFRQLLTMHPKLRQPVVHKLLRRGEIMNIIAPPKAGKSWLVIMLVLCIVTGRRFMGEFLPNPGRILLLDNELHGETIADRIPRVARAMDIGLDEYADSLFVENLRGKLMDIYQLEKYLRQYRPGDFQAVVLDALYRFLPPGVSENDNAQMAQVFNQEDYYAATLDASLINIHHSSKGIQGGKNVIDTGAGAGAIARATDTHLVIRAHKEQGIYVMDAVARSFAPLDSLCLRWEWPLWSITEDHDPSDIKTETARAAARASTKADKREKVAAELQEFRELLAAHQPASFNTLKHEGGMSHTRAKELMAMLEEFGEVEEVKIGRWERWRFLEGASGTAGQDNGTTG